MPVPSVYTVELFLERNVKSSLVTSGSDVCMPTQFSLRE